MNKEERHFRHEARKMLGESMRSQGMTYRAIAKKLGMSRSAGYRLLNPYGVCKIRQQCLCRTLIVRKKRPREFYPSLGKLTALGIKREDFQLLGVTRVKFQAKRNFREKIFQVGLTREREARYLIEAHKAIQKIKYPPISADNCNELLEVMKGFKTTADVDYGLNGPA